jgi:TolA-binding protein
MKRAAVCLLILILFSSICPASENPKEVELLFMARKAYEDGFYEVCLGMLERFQKDFKDSAKLSQVRLLSGQCYFNQGRYLEALNILEELSGQPQASNLKDAIYFWMAEVHFKGGNFQKSAALYEKLITEFPHSSYCAVAYYSLGWSFSQTGQYRQAVQVFNSLLARFPTEPQSKDAAFKLIECLYSLKEYSELKNKINPILRLYTNDEVRLPYLYFYLAESEYYLNNLDEAVKDYLKAVQDFKDQKVQALAKLGLGWAYLKLSKYKDAENVFSDIKQNLLDKKTSDILVLGQALLMASTNRIYEAKNLYGQLISTASDPLIRSQAYLGKADAFYNLAEYSQAADICNEALNIASVQSAIPEELIEKLRYTLALSYIKQGMIDSGVEILDSFALRRNSREDQVSLFIQIAEAYASAGEFLKAQEYYNRILTLYPDLANADYVRYQIGLLQLRKTDYDAAISSFGFLLKKYPQSKFVPDAVYSLGLAYFQKADYVASCEIFAKFQNEFKDSPLRAQACYMLGSSFLGLGKTNEALNIFKEIPKICLQDVELLQKAEYEVADCLYKLGQENEAANKFKLLRTKYPDSKLAPDILWWLGQYYYRHNDLNLARRYFVSLTNDYPNSNLTADAFYAIGVTFADENKFQQATDNFKMAISLGNTRLKNQSKIALGDIYIRQDNLKEALVQYQEVIKDGPDLAKLLFPRIADAYYKIGDYANAKLFYSKSIEIVDDREIAGLRFSFGETLECAGEFDAAIRQYILAADRNEQPPELFLRSLLRAAKLYEDKENFKEALKIYKRIIEKAPTSIETGFVQERIDWINSGRK